MLERRAYPDLLESGRNSSFGRPDGISTAPVSRFRTVLHPREIALCEALVGAELERNGYRVASSPLAPSDAFQRQALDRPWSALIGALHATAFRWSGVARA
jgi:hypothetical protein